MNKINLKRASFANQIRRQALQNKKKTIRKQITSVFTLNLIESEQQMTRIQNCICQCQDQNMSSLRIKIVLEMLLFSDVSLISTSRNVQFLVRILDVVHSKEQYNSYFKKQVMDKIIAIAKKIITFSLEHKQYRCLENCFPAILYILQMETFKQQNFQCWIQLSQIPNTTISKSTVFTFIRIYNNISNLTGQVVSLVIQVICNFLENNLSINFMECHTELDLITILSSIMNNFILIDIDLCKASKSVYIFLERGKILQNKIQSLLQSQILNKLFNYLDKNLIENLSDKTVIQVLMIVGKVFSASNYIAQRVWSQCMNIIGLLRQCIPINKITQKDEIIKYSRPVKLKILRNIIFAFSNIVAISLDFVQTFIKSDICECLKFIYYNSNRQVQTQISYVFYNIVICLELPHFAILEQKGLVNFINVMLRQDENIVQINALGMIQILIKLTNTQKPSIFKCRIQDYKRDLQNMGIPKFIQGLIVSKNQQISKLALSIMQQI